MPGAVTIYRNADDRWPVGGVMRFCARQDAELLDVDVDSREWQGLLDVYGNIEQAIVCLETAAGQHERVPFEHGSGSQIIVQLSTDNA